MIVQRDGDFSKDQDGNYRNPHAAHRANTCKLNAAFQAIRGKLEAKYRDLKKNSHVRILSASNVFISEQDLR